MWYATAGIAHSHSPLPPGTGSFIMRAVPSAYLQILSSRVLLSLDDLAEAITEYKRLLTVPNVDYEECGRQRLAIEKHALNFMALHKLFLDALSHVMPS